MTGPDTQSLSDVTQVKDPDSEGATVYERWAATNMGIHVSLHY